MLTRLYTLTTENISIFHIFHLYIKVYLKKLNLKLYTYTSLYINNVPIIPRYINRCYITKNCVKVLKLNTLELFASLK